MGMRLMDVVVTALWPPLRRFDRVLLRFANAVSSR